MSITLYHTGTRYTYNQVTFLNGTQGDVISVGLYHTTSATYIPVTTDFTTVTLNDGTATPPDPLAITGQIDIVGLIGSRGQITNLTTAGDYQRWIYIKTSTEDIIAQVDVVTVM